MRTIDIVLSGLLACGGCISLGMIIGFAARSMQSSRRISEGAPMTDLAIPEDLKEEYRIACNYQNAAHVLSKKLIERIARSEAELTRARGELERAQKYANLCDDHADHCARGHMPSSLCVRCLLSRATTMRFTVEQERDELRQKLATAQAALKDAEAKVERLSRPVSDEEMFHFETDEVCDIVTGTEYMRGKIERALRVMTSGERWSMYRAIAKLVIASRLASVEDNPPAQAINPPDKPFGRPAEERTRRTPVDAISTPIVAFVSIEENCTPFQISLREAFFGWKERGFKSAWEAIVTVALNEALGPVTDEENAIGWTGTNELLRLRRARLASVEDNPPAKEAADGK